VSDELLNLILAELRGIHKTLYWISFLLAGIAGVLVAIGQKLLLGSN